MATCCSRKWLHSVIIVHDNEMAGEQCGFDTRFYKRRKKKSQKSINITWFTSFTSLQSPGTEFQRLHTKQSGFNYLFGWRKMDAIKLEIDKNDQFEMIKHNPQFTPYLSDLDYILQMSLCRPVWLSFGWTTKRSSVRSVVWTKTVWQREPVRVVKVNKAFPPSIFHPFDGLWVILIASAVGCQSLCSSQSFHWQSGQSQTSKGVCQIWNFPLFE